MFGILLMVARDCEEKTNNYCLIAARRINKMTAKYKFTKT